MWTDDIVPLSTCLITSFMGVGQSDILNVPLCQLSLLKRLDRAGVWTKSRG